MKFKGFSIGYRGNGEAYMIRFDTRFDWHIWFVYGPFVYPTDVYYWYCNRRLLLILQSAASKYNWHWYWHVFSKHWYWEVGPANTGMCIVIASWSTQKLILSESQVLLLQIPGSKVWNWWVGPIQVSWWSLCGMASERGAIFWLWLRTVVSHHFTNRKALQIPVK